MEVKLIMKSARNAVIEIADGGIYNTKETYHVLPPPSGLTSPSRHR